MCELNVTESARKNAGAEDQLPKMSQNCAPRCGTRAIRKLKSLTTGGVGPFFEVRARKICTTLWREKGLEVKAVKNRSGSALFEVDFRKKRLHHAVARKTSNSLKHQGLGTFIEVQNVFCVASAMLSTCHKICGRHKVS